MDEKYLNALNKVEGIGPQRIRILLNFFQNPQNVWQAELDELKLSRIGEKTAEKIFWSKKNINPEEEWEKMQKENIEIIPFNDDRYPSLLKEIHNPPYTIYQKGNFNLNDRPIISIVGARKYTSYGEQIARSFSRDLAQAGFSIVSGMALGIDSFAHKGALDAEGKTVAVLGNSLDDKNIYPQEHFKLSQRICESGALISEYPIETKAGTLTFPARNRLIAGLSLGTLVVEAGEKSGSLITAQMALEYNREIFSVPGSIFSPVSHGTNNLIKNGAKTVTGVKNILEELNFLDEGNAFGQETIRNPSSQEEEILLKILSSDPLHIDNISKMAKLQTATVSSTLSLMEIRGWVKNIGGQNYILL